MKSITPITDPQINQMVRFVQDSSVECIETALRQMRDDKELSKEELQLALGRANRLKQLMIPLYKGMMKKMIEEDVIGWESDLIIPPQSRFVVAENFTKENKTVKFWYFGDNFEAMFMPMTEKEVGETMARVGKLRVQAKLARMTPELGENRILTTSQLYWMLLQQPQGEKPNGKNRRLLTDGSSNILRVLDKDGVERAVDADWFEGYGWDVRANDLGYDVEWSAGFQVVSRK